MRRTRTRAVLGGRSIRRRRGGAINWGKIKDFFVNKVNPFLKKTKIASSVLSALGNVVPLASTGSNIVKSLGYGKKRVVRRRATSRTRVVRKSATSRPRVMRKPRVSTCGGRRRRGGSLKSFLSAAHGVARKHKLISRGLSLANDFIPQKHALIRNLVSQGHRLSSAHGYGLRRKRTTRRVGGMRRKSSTRKRGGSLKSFLSAAHGVARKHKLLSRGLSLANEFIPQKHALIRNLVSHGHRLSSAHGYGLRRKRVSRKRGGLRAGLVHELGTRQYYGVAPPTTINVDLDYLKGMKADEGRFAPHLVDNARKDGHLQQYRIKRYLTGSKYAGNPPMNELLGMPVDASISRNALQVLSGYGALRLPGAALSLPGGALRITRKKKTRF
jgi:hypothetical protein